jgi:lysine-N-methylase
VEREIEGELDFDENEEEVEFSHNIRDARDTAIQILQNRAFGIRQRTAVFLRYAKAVQELLNSNQAWSGQIEWSWEEELPCNKDEAREHELFMKRMLTFTGLESIRADWQDILVLLQSRYITPEDGAKVYHRDMEAWQQYVLSAGKEYEYEHLLVYYAFMCLARCVDDYDFFGKAKLCVVSFLMIRDMDMVRYCTTGCYKMEDRLEITRIYAKEVEHSEENLNFLAEDFLFEDAYTIENLLYSL